MNWLGTQMALIDAATGTLEFAVNGLLQSTILIAVGLIIGRLMRRRGSAVQSVVYRTTIAAVFICPLATWGLSQAGFSGWSVDMPAGWSDEQAGVVVAEVDPPVSVTAAEFAEPMREIPLPTKPSPSLREDVVLEGTNDVGPAPIVHDAARRIEASRSVAASLAEASVESPISQFSVHRFGVLALGVSAVWMLVACGLTLRLATAWRHLARLRRTAAGADAETVRMCHEVAATLDVSAPDVLRSPCVPSPCLAGIRRPAVLLPEVDQSLSIREVLIHELAHLRRRDCHWNLLRQLATAVFFFQPLLWKLSRRLETTAEEVCDDYVVEFGGDRQQYAHRLVDLAELSSAPIAAAGVGIVSLRSMLARRVARIMDTSRTLSTRVNNLLLVVVIVGGLVSSSIVGLVGLRPQSSLAEVESLASESDAASSIKDLNDNDDAEASIAGDVIAVRGKVVDPDGKPFAGATIHIARWYWDPDVPKVPLATAASGPDGRFEITYRKSQFNVDVRRPDMWKEVTILASASGFGPGFVSRDDLKAAEEPTLKLVRDDVPITGRVIDLEGNPLSGITIKAGGLAASPAENLDPFLEALRQGEILWEATNRYLGKYAPQNPEGITETVVTKSDGSFQLTGFGKERRIRISLEGPTIAYTEATIVTRRMKPIVANDGMPNPDWSSKHTIYGADCKITVHPTQPIVGTVRDAESGDPLPGVAVESLRMTERGISQQRLIRVTSDEQGRFELVGMPKGPGKRIIAVPNDGQPYLMREFDVPDQPGLEPIEIELELHRGVWITGRVTDKTTGDPVPARIHYLPYRTNPFAQALPEFDKHGNVDGYQQRYTADSKGVYRVVGLPGRAIVGVESIINPYPRGMGHESIEGLDEHGHFPTYRNPVGPGRLWPTAMKEVDVAEDAEQVQLHFELDAGISIMIHTVDQNGHKLAGLDVVGKQNREHPESVSDSTFHVVAMAPGEERTLLLHHPERRLGQALQIVTSDDAPRELTVQLEPCATIHGQLVDDNHQPITGARLRVRPLPGGDFSPELESVATDAEGRFEHNGVLPGALYNVMSESTQIGFKTIAEKLVIQPGETIDLGTIDITSDERPEAVRTKAVAQVDAAEARNIFADGATGPEASIVANDVSRRFEGEVVDPTGQSVEGAELYLVFYVPQPTGLLAPIWKPLATTNAAGGFRFTVSPSDFGNNAAAQELDYSALVAVKEGFGFAWSYAGKYEKGGNWLGKVRSRLMGAPAEYLTQMKNMLSGADEPLILVVDDHPIHGRVVDINGQPVAGARLTLMEVWSGLGDDLTAWREAAREPKADYYSARMKLPMMMNGPQVRSVVIPAVTDANGRFALRGVGRGRIAELLLEGPGIESAKIFARTEAGEKIELMRERRSPDLGSYIYHPAELTHVAGPSTAITGIVRDSVTQAPLSGVTVKSQSRHGEQISGWGQDFVRAVTDEQGRYRLDGMPVGSGNRIAAIAPPSDIAYFSMSKRAATTSQDGPLMIDFELLRGVWIEGRITDGQTGKGLAGRLAYYVKKQSPSYAMARSLDVDERDRLQTDDDGKFRMAALPGPGFVTFMAHEHQNYPRTEAIVKPDGSREKVSRAMLETARSILMPRNYHLVVEIDPAPEANRVELNLKLDRGDSVVGRVVDPDGKLVTGYYYAGQMAQFFTWKLSVRDKFELRGYEPKSPRHVYFAHRERNLAGHVVLEGEPPKDFVVTLQPAGDVKGRLVDADGVPLGNCQLVPWQPPMSSPADRDGKYHAPPLPRNLAHLQSGEYETDDEGRFEISCLVPGVEYRLLAFDRASMSPARGRAPKFSGPLDVVVKVARGESKDLGDVRLADEAEFGAAANQSRNESRNEQAKQQTVVRGKITMAGGKPVADVHVAVIAMRNQLARGDDLSPRGEVLADGTTDSKGKYRLNLGGASSKTHSYASVIARKAGAALAWKRLNLDETDVEASLELPAQEPISGKLVDIEGQPAAGVRLLVHSLVTRSTDGVPGRDGVGFRGEPFPNAYVPPVASDDEGRFTVNGIPSGHGVFLNVVGTDRFAPQDIALNTGMPEQRGERDRSYRPLVKNVDAGEEAVLALAPAQLIEGVVTYEDTGKPAPNARLTVYASQQEFGSWFGVAGVADAEGRYRISPKPGIRFSINAFPPDTVAYLARGTPPSEAFRWRAGDRARHVNMTLPRGVLVRGKVVEAETRAAVAGASIQYLPERDNNSNTSDDIITGWQETRISNERGDFEIAVLPGPGRLLVHGPQNEYVVRETTFNEIASGRPGGSRQYAHQIQPIDLTADQSPLEVTFELRRGSTVSGTLADESGVAVDEALLVSWRNIHAWSPGWRGESPTVSGGQFEMSGLVEGEEYSVHFLEAKRKLGATAVIRADDPSPRVVLQACGSAVMRLVDNDGNPVPHLSAVNVHLVVRPGVHKYDSEAIRSGAVAADSDFISNVDRVNYPGPASTDTDGEGRLRLPVLIPGATYRIVALKEGTLGVVKEFVAESGQSIDLGDLVVDAQGE